MTIRVTVTNADASASHPVEVEMIDRGAPDSVTGIAPAVSGGKRSLAPGASADFYVHSMRDLSVREV